MEFYKDFVGRIQGITLELARLHKTDEDMHELIVKNEKKGETQGRQLDSLAHDLKLLDGKAKLERTIDRHEGAVVIISHDRYLLDVLADSIAELEVSGQHAGRNQLTVVPGNYSEYAHTKREVLLKQQKDHAIGEREAGRLKQSIQRLKDFSSNGQNAKKVRR